MKEAHLKRLHTVGIHLCNNLEKATYGECEKISGCQGFGEGDEQTEHVGLGGKEKCSVQHYNGGHVSLHLCKPTECTTVRVSPDIN